MMARLILLLCLAVPAAALAEARGLPLVTWYAPAEYGAGTQIWAVTQDHRGFMYFGGEGVVLVFDSARWRRVPVLPSRAVRSLATAADGTVLVGSQGDFGLLEADALGELRYRSLRSRFEGELPPFRDVWQVLVLGTRWLFSTDEAVFEIDARSTRILRGPGPVAGSFLVDGEVYSYFTGHGLHRLGPAGYEAVTGAERLPAPVYAVLRARDGALLIGMRPGGLLRLDPDGPELKSVWPEVDAYLERHHLYHALKLPDGRIGLATLRGGLLLLDAQTGRFEILDTTRGLPNSTVRKLFVDAEDGLWMALDNGIARIEGRSAIERWDQRLGLMGTPLCVRRFDGVLHVGTTVGLYRLDADRFRPVRGIESEVWTLLVDANAASGPELLAATSYGVMKVKGLEATPLSSPYLTVGAAISPAAPRRLWIATYDEGLGHIDLDASAPEAVFVGPSVQPCFLHLDPDGGLWLETWSEGLYRLDPADGRVRQRYPGPAGPETAGGLTVLASANRRLLASVQGIWRLQDEGAIERAHDLEGLLAVPGTGSALLVEGPPGVVWSAASDGYRQWLRIADLSGEPRAHALDARLRALTDIEFYNIQSDGERHAWISGSEALYRIDLHADNTVRPPLGLDLIEVEAGGVSRPLESGRLSIELDARSFPLRIAWAAPTFDWPGGTRYRHRLQGLGSAWSPWRAEAEREFSHLPPGDYALEVQARDAFGRTAEASWNFAVARPWFLKAPAVVLWIALVAAAIVLLLRLGGRRQARRSRMLESLVAQRTTELRDQQALLQAERDKLARLSREDELTGLANRREANERMRIEWARAQRTGGDLALAMIDIDHFKAINDRFGHESGDSVLRRFAQLVTAHCRESDSLARWGGEEFLLLLPGTDREAARAMCERIRATVAHADWGECGPSSGLSVSVGIATAAGHDDRESMLAAADRALYRAKRRGRNRVVGESDPS